MSIIKLKPTAETLVQGWDTVSVFELWADEDPTSSAEQIASLCSATIKFSEMPDGLHNSTTTITSVTAHLTAVPGRSGESFVNLRFLADGGTVGTYNLQIEGVELATYLGPPITNISLAQATDLTVIVLPDTNGVTISDFILEVEYHEDGESGPHPSVQLLSGFVKISEGRIIL